MTRLASLLVLPAALLVLMAPPGVATAQEGGPPNLLATFVRLDRVYIPVLALASEGHTEDATLAVVRLKHVWSRLYSRYVGAYDSAAWRDALDAVSRHVAEGTTLLQQGEPKEAHRVLESVRVRLREARRAVGIDYYPDRLTAFHEPMEAIVLATRGREKLGEAEVAELRALLLEAYRRWTDVLTADFDAERFGFPAERTAELSRLQRRESEALNALRTALERGDEAAILAAGPRLKPPFAQAYKLFGDFAGLRAE